MCYNISIRNTKDGGKIMKYALSFTIQNGIVTTYMNNNIATCNSYSRIGDWEFCTTVFDSLEEYQKVVKEFIRLGVAKKLDSLIIQ